MTDDITINDLQIELTISRVDLKKRLRKTGYSYRRAKGDFIRRDGNGRFHIKFNRYGRLFMHYDLFSVFNGRHISSIPMKQHLQREVERMKHYLSIYGV
jgi:hypothetical protein